jgi:hypothetical protein
VSTVRALLPTDFPALLAHPGLSGENAAYPRERLGAAEAQATLSVMTDQLRAFARQRRAWVSVRRQRLQGLVGARRRGGNAAWEIDYLVDCTPDQAVTAALLESATAHAGKDGAHKIFLRLPFESDLLHPVLEAGFSAYLEESLYARQGAAGSAAAPEGLRQASPSDSYPAFRLYCEAVPENVRRFEAATFEEWHAAQERHWQRNGHQLVIEREGRLQAQIRACRLPQGLMLDVLVGAGATDDLVALVDAAARAADAASGPAFVLLPQAAEGMGAALEGAGFSRREDYVSLVRRTAKPLTLPRKVPVVAENAVRV